MTDQRLEGRHVIVTGAAKGIGRGIAERVATAGADVTIFDIDTEGATETRAAIEDQGRRAKIIEVDVSAGGEVSKGVNAAIDGFGPIHGLVNNAGIQHSIQIF